MNIELQNSLFAIVNATAVHWRSCAVVLLCACAALMLAGCAKQQQYEAVEQICIEGEKIATENTEKLRIQAMQAAEEVLSEMYFTIEKFDAEQGIIRTRPLAGAQFFEF